MTVAIYILYFFFYSAIGWLGESIYCSLGAKKWVNRGFLTGPMCPIYGTGAITMAVVLTPVKNLDISVPVFGYDIPLAPLFVFLAGMVVCDIVEFITSVLMEKLFHARWWDYSNKRFNIQGRICLGHTFYWGIASLLFLYVAHPIVSYCFSRLLDRAVIIILAVVLVLFLADLAHAVYTAMDVRKFVDKLQSLSGMISNFADDVKSNFNDRISSLDQKRSGVLTRFESWRTDAYLQLREMVQRPSGKEDGEKKKMRRFNRQIMNSPNLLPYVNRQMQKLEDMLEEIKKAFNDDSDDELY